MKNQRMKRTKTRKKTLLLISTLCWLTAFPVPARLKLTSQRLILAKISNKHPFLTVEEVGTYLTAFPTGWVLIQAGCDLKEG